jgi:hypothetical protein
MIKKVARLLAIFAVAATPASAASDWPPLPSRGFVTGRAANQSDIVNGDAIFVAAVKDVVIGKPLPIQIPQYALLRDTRERVIVVQAEEANGLRLVGIRHLDGKEAVVTEPELEFLGTRKPSP